MLWWPYLDKTSDWRRLKIAVNARIALPESRSIGDFFVTERYPVATVSKTVPNLLLKEGVPTSFHCTSNQEWNACHWKRPGSDHSCGILADDRSPKDCDVWTEDIEAGMVTTIVCMALNWWGVSGWSEDNEAKNASIVQIWNRWVSHCQGKTHPLKKPFTD